jgi:hypothetical protein
MKSLSFFRQRSFLFAILFAFLCVTRNAQSQTTNEPVLVPLGITNGQFHFLLDAETNQDYVVDASTNLIDWVPVLEQPQAPGPLEIVDPIASSLNVQFYRARKIVLSALKPSEVDVFIGDSLLFLIEATGAPANWQFTVNGIVGGNASVGFIQSQTNNSSQALYVAPTSGGEQTVTICATDPNDPSRQYCATVHVHPIPAQLIIVPAAPTDLRLGGQLQFSAGAIVEGVGFVPLRQVYWKVNGQIGGDGNLGMINFNGLYNAPLAMPSNAPVLIDVGFSLAHDGAVMASNDVTLVELLLDPPLVQSLSTGYVATVTVQMRRSDAPALLPVPAGDVHFESGNDNIATVNGNGDIFLGLTEGRSPIQVTHNLLGTSAMMTVEARSNCHIRPMEIEPITEDVVRIQRSGSFTLPEITQIEATRPGISFRISPDLYFFRGVLRLFTNSVSGGGGTNLTITGDGVNVIDYSRSGPPIQPSGTVAVVERETGIVTFGDKAGSGTIQFTYNDGFIIRSTTLTLTFTRLTLKVSGAGETTGRTNDPFVTEWYDFSVTLTNELANSDFVANTTVRVRMAGDETFRAAYYKSVDPAGLIVLPWASTFNETRELLLDVLTTKPDNSEQIAAVVTRGNVNFRISPNRAGEHRFIIDVPGDTLIPPQEIVLNVIRPPLRIRSGYAEFNSFSGEGYGAFSNSLITANSWVDLEQDGSGPPLDLYRWENISIGYMHDVDPLVWRIRHPDNSTEVLPYYRNLNFFGAFNRFNGQFRQLGTYHISLGFSERSEIRSEELAIPVIAPGVSFPEVANASKLIITNSDGDTVPASSQLGGLAILSPTSGSWVRNVPITVQLQCYDANGNPARIGKRILQVDRFSNTSTVNRSTNYQVVQILPRRLVGPEPRLDSSGQRIFAFGVTLPLADASGQVQFSMTMKDSTTSEDSRDFAMAFLPILRTLSSGEFELQGGSPGLPDELIETMDGVVVNHVRVPIGVTQFASAPDKSLLQPALMLPGRGIIASPQFVPIASGRVRQAVANGKLPPEAANVTFQVVGGTGFQEAINSGIASINLGPGITLLNSSPITNGLQITASTDYSYFGTNSALYVPRTITLVCDNGTTNRVDIGIVGYRLETISAQKDFNIPLNAAYGYTRDNYPFFGTKGTRFPDGSVNYEVAKMNYNNPLYTMELQLHPSIHACWDANQDGIGQPAEDIDSDGEFTELDNTGGVLFRGALSENPLIGFERGSDPQTGASIVRRLHTTLTPSSACFFAIYGDLTDRRRWNREMNQLGPKGDRDQIPDFASRSANAEGLSAIFGGNLADYVSFTAYNFVATPKADLVDPGISFTNVMNSMDNAYALYGGLNPDAALQSLLTNAKITGSMSVHVDHEANSTYFRDEKDYLQGFIPWQFYGGVLDQFYQRTTKGGGYGYYTTTREIGRDGRVRPYDRPADRLVTGVSRAFFGIDLDGVFYDPNWINFPRPRDWDPNPLKILAAGRVIDALPNSEELLEDVLLADMLTGGTNSLTTNNLVPRFGGSSGGYVGLDRWNAGSAKVEAKTPGADLPGLHAGYLLLNRPEDLIDPRNNLVEDDIRDVLIKRDGEGGPIKQAEIFLGAKEQRFVHAFAENDDNTRPIQTAAQMNYSFLVTTDPVGVTPRDTNLWKLHSAIIVREKPMTNDFSTDLIVTTQSDGNEKTVKLLADTAVDVVAEVVVAAVFGVVSRSGGATCNAELGSKLMHIGVDLAINGISDSEYVEDFIDPQELQGRRKAYEFTRKVLNEGFETPIPGVTVPGFNNAFALDRNDVFKLKLKLSDLPGSVFATPCDLFSTPVKLLAGSIKSKYSAETFGGLGSAEAIGAKILTIAIPTSAWLTNNAVYSANFNLTRRIDIQPVEATAVALDDLPWQGLFTTYPYGDEVSDEELLQVLNEKKNDPGLGDAATTILRAIGRKSVIRYPRFTNYSHYKMRAWNLPSLSGMVAPGQSFGSRTFGDFALVPGEAEIPVSSANVAIARRSNENSGARAKISSPGYEMVLVGGVIMDPGPPH